MKNYTILALSLISLNLFASTGKSSYGENLTNVNVDPAATRCRGQGFSAKGIKKMEEFLPLKVSCRNNGKLQQQGTFVREWPCLFVINNTLSSRRSLAEVQKLILFATNSGHLKIPREAPNLLKYLYDPR